MNDRIATDIAPFVRRDVDARGVITLTLDRPQSFNALSEGMLAALQAELDAVAADETARAVVIAATGKAFCAGHDLKEMRATPSLPYYEALFAQCARMMLTIQRLPVPVIARVQGIATAAGCQLVAACDLAVASDTARFATPGVNIGLFCSTPMVPISRSIGRKRVLEMLLTGDMIDAATALDWGLVNRVVPPEQLDAATTALAERIVRASPYVVALGKRAFYAQEAMDETEAYALTCGVMVENAQAADAAEGMHAFLEKRAPSWRGP